MNNELGIMNNELGMTNVFVAPASGTDAISVAQCETSGWNHELLYRSGEAPKYFCLNRDFLSER
jgi:hypothetical protein